MGTAPEHPAWPWVPALAPSLSLGLGKGHQGLQSHARAGSSVQTMEEGWCSQPELTPPRAHLLQPARLPITMLYLPTCDHLPNQGGKREEGWGGDWQVGWRFSTEIQSRRLQPHLSHGQVRLEQDDSRSNMV